MRLADCLSEFEGPKSKGTHLVSSLLVLVSLLVGSSLGVVWRPLLVAQSLPALTQDLANLAECDTGVLLPDVVTLLVGEEHVCGETTLGGHRVLLGAALLRLGALLSSGLRHGEWL